MRRKIKWIFTVIAMLISVYLGTSVTDDELGSRAMAVGLGIDVEGDEVVVCAQILTSAETEGTPASTKVVQAKDKILSSAISKITKLCGKTLTVTHCNVVILGENLIKNKSLDSISTLIENTYISDNAYVFGCEGVPKEVFSSKSAFGENASQYLQQLISTHGAYDSIPYKTMRQVTVDTHNIGQTTYMPYIKKVTLSPIVPPSSADETSDDEEYSYDLTSLLVLKGGKYVGVYDENGSKTVNYVMTKVDKGSDDFVIDRGIVGLYIMSADTKKKFDLAEKTAVISLKIGATVKDLKMNGSAQDDSTFAYELTDEDKVVCENEIKKRIDEFYKEMQEVDADVFELRQSFYSKYGKKAENLTLQEIKMEVKVELSIEK